MGDLLSKAEPHERLEGADGAGQAAPSRLQHRNSDMNQGPSAAHFEAAR
jgi:hypothetical protein